MLQRKANYTHVYKSQKKYGHRLTAGDGRDCLIDAYQEALDLVVYLRKAIRELRGI